ncbi:MAG: cysteine desulfurase NifS [Dehalococcoidia bacterium]|nr:MAG: cysteine desulfurase NifS [Dehalococcoidia bacterium]
MKRIYLDYAATTPADPEVVKAMLPYFTESFGNPSSLYSYGQENKVVLDEAREKIARAIGAHSDEIIFTSGGTEADNTALAGVAWANKEKGHHIITTAIEHHAILETCHFLGNNGFDITIVPVDHNGIVNPDDIKKAITPKTLLISVMHANNEVGSIQPIEEIGRIAKEAGVYMHTDAVQTVGHIPVDVNRLGVDLLSLSAHKLYGPKGVGLLYARRGTRIASYLHGGSQEKGRRAGTENVAGIVGLSKAVELAMNDLGDEMRRQTLLRDRLIKGLLDNIELVHLNGHPTQRLPNNVNVSIDYVEGESMLLNLDLEDICVSTGSACSSTSQEPSHVLTAMGVPPEKAHCSLRLTLGKWTTEADIERVLGIMPQIVARLRSMSPLMKAGK